MIRRVPAAFRSALYALRGGFLLRPFVIALALGAAGAGLSSLEETFPTLRAAMPAVLFPSRADPQTAQVILSDIATTIMTVVSIVFAILLMTLTLASTQFSPRILVGFVRDRVMQWTLGVFLGTFSYCIAALPAARSAPTPFVPIVTVAGAMLLVPACIGWLVFFIHHISLAISVNTIVDRIRRETELVMDKLMPERRRPVTPAPRADHFSEPLDFALAARQTGYIRFVDIKRLRALARTYRVCLRLERRVGHFVPEGATLFILSHRERISEERAAALLATVDIGPVRTLQQDIEFGIVQIVDIGLKAISPAVNDPTTAISCVDHLSSLMIRWLDRAPAIGSFFDPPHVLRVVVPWIGFEGLLDLAFEQLRHYAEADAAVSLRLMRALIDIASTVDDPATRHTLQDRGRRVVAGCNGKLQQDDFRRLQERLARFDSDAGAQ